MNFKSDSRSVSFLEKKPAMKRGSLKDNSFEGGVQDERKQNSFLVKLLDWIFSFSLFAIFLGVPLFFTGFSYQGLVFEKQLYFYFFSLLALFAWASRCGFLGEMRIRKTPLDIPILIFWLSYLISTIFSLDKWHSFFGFFGDPSRGFLNVSALIIVYYLILSNFNEKLQKRLLLGIFLSGMVVSVWTFLVSFGIAGMVFPDSFLGKIPFSLIGSLSGTAVFLMMLVPLGIMRVFQLSNGGSRKKIGIVFHLILIGINLAALFAIYGHAFWLAFLIGMVVFLVFVLAKIVEVKNGWAILPMAIFLIILVFLMVGPISFFEKKIPVSVDVPYKVALEISKESLGERFFFGSGAANYGYSFSKYLPAGFDSLGLRFYQGQGLFLENISTIGAVGAIFFSVLILTYLGVALFLLSRDKEKNKIGSLGFFSASFILLLSVLSQRTDGTILILWVLVSTLFLAVVYRESNIRDEYFTFSLKASPKFALTLAFIYLIVFAGVVFSFVFFGKVLVADFKMGSVSGSDLKVDETSVQGVMESIEINPHEGRYFVSLGQRYMALTNQEMLKSEEKRNMEKIRQYLSLAIQAGKKGEDIMKNDVRSVESLAQIYENAGMYIADAYDLSEEKYKRAVELEPFNPDFLVKLGQVKIKKSQVKEKEEEKKKLWEEAKQDYEKALGIKPNYAPAYNSLALAYEALGDRNGAIEKMSQAFLLERTNVNYAFNLARLYQDRGEENDLKIAESLYKQILEVNEKEINTLFGLGMLYEKMNKKGDAIEKYENILTLIGSDSGELRDRIGKMIDNVKNNIPNTPENLGLVQSEEEVRVEDFQEGDENKEVEIVEGVNEDETNDKDESGGENIIQ